MDELAIFTRALDKVRPEERAAFLQEACGDDASLRARVEALLRSHEAGGSFLQGSPLAGAPATIDQTPLERPGMQIGPYKLLQQIGEGGMGTVYLAEQTEPVQRQVALKVIKPGMDSHQVIARFEAERQALALMDHVNIARVLDAGATESGRPYFVMELVHGVPITKYCDDNHLTPRERLELFVPVCQAIQHAHQKGIIHRDIKPSNVMVTLYDGQPVPKVIDFGVAKATEQKLTERTLFTQYGTMVGTLEYMSPEQAEMSALGVDTRSDIYSLGVLLYELLTGSTPLSSKRMKDAAYAEILRMIKEEEPPKPSTRLSDSGEALASISANRQTEPAKLTKLVRGELDWIVMKTLEKERNRRYETPKDFAADVQRYLSDEPVQACPPSALYRFRKYARRHKVAFVTTAVVAIALLVGTVVSAWQAIRATRAERAAQQERNEAVEHQRRADEQSAIARAVNDFLQHDLLSQVDSTRQADRHEEVQPGLTVREALDRAAARIGDRFQDQPLVEAAIRKVIGEAYRAVGEPRLGIPHLERSVALRKAELGPDHPGTLFSMGDLARAYRVAGQLAEAVALHEETLRRQRALLGPDHPSSLTSMNNLALAYREAGRYAESGTLHEETLKRRRALLGPDHSDTLTSMNNVALAWRSAGRFVEAVALQEETLSLQKRILEPNHPYTLTSMNNLANAYRAVGRQAEATALYEETLQFRRAILGPDHFDTLLSLHNVALAYRDTGRPRDARPLFEEALKGQKAKLGSDHGHTLSTINYLASLYSQLGEHGRAEPLLYELLEVRRRKLGPEHLEVAATLASLGRSRLEQQKYDGAEPVLRECLAIREKHRPSDWHLFDAMSLLGGSLLGQQEYAAAEPLLVQGYEGMKQRELAIAAPGKLPLSRALERVVQLYEAWGRKDQALDWRTRLERAKADTPPMK